MYIAQDGERLAKPGRPEGDARVKADPTGFGYPDEMNGQIHVGEENATRALARDQSIGRIDQLHESRVVGD